MYIGIHNHKFCFKRPLPVSGSDSAVLDSCGIDDGIELDTIDDDVEETTVEVFGATLVVGGISVVGGPGWS